MTLAELQAKREAVLSSVGQVRVRFSDGREVEYSRQSDALAAIDREIAALDTTTSKVFVVQTKRGLL